MAKGMVGFEDCSLCVLLISLKYPLLAEPGGSTEVGEGSTSVSREGGSFLVLSHMPLPQGKELVPEWPLPAPTFPWECVPHVLDSAEGVLGCDAVGDIELEAKEFFRGGAPVCVVSFSQEALRVGFGGWVTGRGFSWRSPSSSELARASESGVDRLPLNLSNKSDGLLDVMEDGFDSGVLPPEFAIFELLDDIIFDVLDTLESSRAGCGK